MPLLWPLRFLFIITGKAPFILEENNGNIQITLSIPLFVLAIITNLAVMILKISTIAAEPGAVSSNIADVIQYLNSVVWFTSSAIL